MSNIESYIPFVIYWEAGVKDPSANNESLFKKAKNRGIVNDRADLGGPTLVGITFATYSGFCRNMGLRTPSASEMIKMTYTEWRQILKKMFWDRWQADEIRNQAVAEMLVDWVWTSGNYGIKLPQKLLGVTTDGIVGTKTLSAVNSREPQSLFNLLRDERLAYTERICKSRPANLKFRTGWINRINACGSPSAAL